MFGLRFRLAWSRVQVKTRKLHIRQPSWIRLGFKGTIQNVCTKYHLANGRFVAKAGIQEKGYGATVTSELCLIPLCKFTYTQAPGS